MKCCQEQWERKLRLPFKYVLGYSYYDGILCGVTTCIKCGRGYLFELLTFDYETQDNRIFGFIEINNSAEQLAQLLGIKKEMGKYGGMLRGNVPPDILAITRDFAALKSTCPHYICASEDSLKTGTWKVAWPMGLLWEGFC
jgi:hypothetical protein